MNYKTRIAPSPTGHLHIGNMFSILLTSAIAHYFKWEVLWRIDDLDIPRKKVGAEDKIIKDLKWIGLRPPENIYLSSNNFDKYVEAMNLLAKKSRTFPCNKSRKDVENSTSAPQEGITEICYPLYWAPDKSFRPNEFNVGGGNCWRFVVENKNEYFNDLFYGKQIFNPSNEVGHFPIWTKNNLPSYQLTCVIDDSIQEITHIVRGNDLLSSTARQITLARELSKPFPKTWHLPLIRGEDGRRLAKRHGDSRIESYRTNGISNKKIIGLIAFWCGLTSNRKLLNYSEFLSLFFPYKIPKKDIIFKKEDQEWLYE